MATSVLHTQAVRVHLPNLTYKAVPVTADTTAVDVIQALAFKVHIAALEGSALFLVLGDEGTSMTAPDAPKRRFHHTQPHSR